MASAVKFVAFDTSKRLTPGMRPRTLRQRGAIHAPGLFLFEALRRPEEFACV